MDKNVNILFNNFLNTFLKIFYACFPIRKKTHHKISKPWVTTGIKISCANVTYRISNNPTFKSHYKNYCKILSSVIITAKKMYFDKLLLKSTNKPSTTWNIVKTLTNSGITSSNIVEMNVHNNLTSNPFTIANAFNSYFSSVAESLKSKNYLDMNSTNNNDPLSYLRQNFNHIISPIRFNNTSTHEVDQIINSLKCKDLCGYDEVSTRILKNSAPYISSPLMYIFNKILSTGIFPDRLKFS